MSNNPNISYHNCTLCPRRCGVNRDLGELGYCNMPDRPIIARAALHEWEEPIISGTNGSGTVFFSGCSLGCVYCQNREISRGGAGQEVSLGRLVDIMLGLADRGAHNINFVTPTHYAPTVVDAVKAARGRGLNIPIVYNTSSYDELTTLRALRDAVDIYLPDFKYYRSESARRLSFAEDYCSVALAAIGEMVKQRPRPIINGGIMTSGVVVRILLLPGHLAEAKLALKQIYSTFGESVYISLMSQYTPMPGMTPPLDRRVTRAEYGELVDYASRLGIMQAFTQSIESASGTFIPSFDGTGVL